MRGRPRTPGRPSAPTVASTAVPSPKRVVASGGAERGDGGGLDPTMITMLSDYDPRDVKPENV
ncbi:MAG: hypothetical protein WBA97_36960 [Actinophytocola sp.]